MPIRIPNHNPSSSGPTPQGVSLSDATAPGLSLGAVAKGLGAVSNVFEEHDERIQKVQNSADLTEIKTRMKSAYAEFQAGLVDRHDHKNYLKDWRDKLRKIQGEVSEGDYSRQVIDQAKEAFTRFKGDSEIGVASAAQDMAVKRQKQAFTNAFDLAVDGYDPSNPSSADIDDIINDYPGTPEEKEAIRNQWDRTVKKKQAFHNIHADPGQWLKDNPKPKRGQDPYEWESNSRMARQVLSRNQRDQADGVLNAIFERKLTDPKDIKALTPDLDAVDRARLEKTLADFHDDELREKMRDPKFQNQVIGEVAAMIAAYEPNGERYDPDFVEIREKVAMLPSGPLKQEFEKEIAGIRGDKEREIKTVKDWASAQIDEVYTDENALPQKPKKPEGRSVSSYLNSGFLENDTRLKQFGFQDSHAEAIAEAAKKEREAELEGEPYKGPSSVDLFRRYYEEGGPAVEDFSYRERAALEAIRDNKGPTHKVVDPGDLLKYDASMKTYQEKTAEAYGRSRREFADFLIENPKPTKEDAIKFLEEIDIDIEAGATNSSWLPSKPKSTRLPEGDEGETGPSGSRGATLGKNFKMNHSSPSARSARKSAGGATILMDSNWKSGNGVTVPMVVTPNTTTADQRAKSMAYAEAMAQLQKEKFGRVLKPKVVTRAQNGRGRSNAFHTEGFAVTDTKMVAYLQTVEGRARYQDIISKTLGQIQGVEFTLPHSAKDPGAPGNGTNEVKLARWLMSK